MNSIKLIGISFFLFCSVSSSAQYIWGIVNDGNNLSSISAQFFNNNEGYFPNGSSINFTSDGGVTTTSMPDIGMSQHYLSSVYFFNLNEGVSIWKQFSDNTFKFFSTTDGGNNWTQIGNDNYETDYTTVGFFDHLTFLNDDFGYTHGKATRVSDSEIIRVIMITTDGGQNWSMKSIPFETDELWDVVYLDPSTVYCANANRVFKSIDGGDNWSELNNFTYSVWDLEFVNSDIAYAVVDDNSPKVFKTTDGGVSWTDLMVNLSPPGGGISGEISSINITSFIDTDNGILGGRTNQSEGVIMRTTDGGASWTRDSLGIDIEQDITGSWGVNQVHFVSADVQYALGGGKLLKMGSSTSSLIEYSDSNVEANLFPNPSSGNIKITSDSEIEKISIRDLSGKTVFTYNPVTVKKELSIQLNHLSEGLYMVNIEMNDGGTSTKKLIIK